MRQFALMLERIAGNGVRTIIVETANRFARDLIVQETGHRMLKGRGIEIIAADSPSAFVDGTPTTTFVRQVLGAVAQFDKAMTVAEQPPPIPIRLTPGQRLDLAPIPALPGAIGRIAAFAHHALGRVPRPRAAAPGRL
jgi:hypothetical protein